MSFPPGTEMFQFPGFASPRLWIQRGDLPKEGLPHSDIRGSTIARISPRLFAACHVLHRLLAPRHPPNALVSLTIQPPNRPHAVPNRATSLQAGQQALRSLYATQPFPDSPVKDLPWREQVSAEGVSWKRPQLGTRGPGRGQPCPTARRQLAGHRERRAEPDDLAGSHCSGRSQPGDIRTQRHALSLKGGDPAAGSPTATLLRLHPSH